jgi:biofilm PGA synthesis N-glycosyltransferase PgaC
LEVYIQQALFIVFQVCFIIQLYYLVAKHYLLAAYKVENEVSDVLVAVSVIISARNEYQNLSKNLPQILNQNYFDFEVVVVNDCSFDETDLLLEGYQKSFPNLKVVTVNEHARFKTGKKFALTLGIKAAKNEHLLFTDADCIPASEYWISQMASKFSAQNHLVLGYSPYKKTGGFLNTFIRFETLKTAVNYLSASLSGDAYMGIGRNLAYTKSLFFSNKGFAAHMHVLSGDDDLFVNQNSTTENTVIQIAPDAHIFTEAKTSIAAYYRQKKRHMGVGKLYKTRHRRFLSFDAASGLLFYIVMAVLFARDFEPWILGGLYVFRLLLQIWIYSKIFDKLRCADLLWWMPFFDVFYYFYLNLFGMIGTFSKTTKWK